MFTFGKMGPRDQGQGCVSPRCCVTKLPKAWLCETAISSNHRFCGLEIPVGPSGASLCAPHGVCGLQWDGSKADVPGDSEGASTCTSNTGCWLGSQLHPTRGLSTWTPPGLPSTSKRAGWLPRAGNSRQQDGSHLASLSPKSRGEGSHRAVPRVMWRGRPPPPNGRSAKISSFKEHMWDEGDSLLPPLGKAVCCVA